MPARKKLDFRVEDNGCYVVTSHRLNKDGYASFYLDGMEQRIHRYVYQECFGPIPGGLVVRHKCDNPGCINPEHLELGTHNDNMRDKTERGRNKVLYGEKNPNSTITAQDALKIKKLLSEGKMPTEISRTLGVSIYAVRGIRERNRWNHVAL